jgi:hypothetical protein
VVVIPAIFLSVSAGRQAQAWRAARLAEAGP